MEPRRPGGVSPRTDPLRDASFRALTVRSSERHPGDEWDRLFSPGSPGANIAISVPWDASYAPGTVEDHRFRTANRSSLDGHSRRIRPRLPERRDRTVRMIGWHRYRGRVAGTVRNEAGEGI